MSFQPQGQWNPPHGSQNLMSQRQPRPMQPGPNFNNASNFPNGGQQWTNPPLHNSNVPPPNNGFPGNFPGNNYRFPQNNNAFFPQNAPPNSAPHNSGFPQNLPPHNAGFLQNPPPNFNTAYNSNFPTNFPPNNNLNFAPNNINMPRSSLDISSSGPPRPIQGQFQNHPNQSFNRPQVPPTNNYNFAPPQTNLTREPPQFPPQNANFQGAPPPFLPSGVPLPPGGPTRHTFNAPPHPHPQGSFMQPPPQDKSFVKLKTEEKEIGCQKLQQWLQKRNKSVKPESKTGTSEKKGSIQIWKFLNDIKEMNDLVTSLSSEVTQMSASLAMTDETVWEASRNKCNSLKDRLCTEFKDLLDEESIQQVNQKLLKVHQKRERLKRKRVIRLEEEQTRLQERAEKSKSIDKWQERLQAKIREENREKRKKAAADRTLSKVTREINDATRLVDTMLALEKLRLIRRDAAQKRGDSDIGESRQQFEGKIEDMTRLVKAQLECYKQEEAKLKLVLKSEEEEKTKLERMAKEDKARHQQEEGDRHLRSILFGPNDEISMDDPLFPYSQYYRQAEHNLPALLHIRQEWDSFVVPEGTPASSRVPSGWVLPALPSSSVWDSALT